jgi:hypothetical protein
MFSSSMKWIGPKRKTASMGAEITHGGSQLSASSAHAHLPASGHDVVNQKCFRQWVSTVEVPDRNVKEGLFGAAFGAARLMSRVRLVCKTLPSIGIPLTIKLGSSLHTHGP